MSETDKIDWLYRQVQGLSQDMRQMREDVGEIQTSIKDIATILKGEGEQIGMVGRMKLNEDAIRLATRLAMASLVLSLVALMGTAVAGVIISYLMFGG